MMAVSLVIRSRKPTVLPFHAVKKTSCHPVKRKYKDKIEKRKHRFWKWQVIQGNVFYNTLQVASVNEILLFMLEKYWCCFHKDIISNFYFCLNIWNSKNKKIQKFFRHVLSSHCNIKTGNLKTSEDIILHKSSCKCYSKIFTTESNTVTYKLMSPHHYKCNCLLSECHICKDFFHKSSDKVHESLQVKRKRSNSFDQETVTNNVPDISPNKANSSELDWKKIEQSCSKFWRTFLVTDPAFSSKKQKLGVSSVESANPMSSHHHILKSGDSDHSLESQLNSVSQTSKTNGGVFHYAESYQTTIDSCQVSFASAEDQEIHHHSLKSGDYRPQNLEISSHGHSNSASQISITEKCVSSLESDETSVNTNKISIAPKDPRLHFHRNRKQKDGISLKRVKWSFDCHNRTNSNCGYAYSKNSPGKNQVQQLCINGYSLQDPRLKKAMKKDFSNLINGYEKEHPANKMMHSVDEASYGKSKLVEQQASENTEVSKETILAILINVAKNETESAAVSNISSNSLLKLDLKSNSACKSELQVMSVSSVSNSSRKHDINEMSDVLRLSVASPIPVITESKQISSNQMPTLLQTESASPKCDTKDLAVGCASIHAANLYGGIDQKLESVPLKSYEQKSNYVSQSPLVNSVIPNVADMKKVEPHSVGKRLPSVGTRENTSPKCDDKDVSYSSENAANLDKQIFQNFDSFPLFESHEQKSNSDSQSPFVNSVIPNATDRKKVAPNSVGKHSPSVDTEESTSLKCDFKDMSYSSENAASLGRENFHKLESVPLFESHKQKSKSVSQSPLINSVIPSEVDIKKIALNSVAKVLDTGESASLKSDTKGDSCDSHSSNLDGQTFEKFKSVPLFESDKQKLNSVSQSLLINSAIPSEAAIEKIALNSVTKVLDTGESASLKCDTKDDSCASPSSNLDGQTFEKFKSVPLFESDKQKLNSVSQSPLINSAIPSEADIEKIALNSITKVLDTGESASLKCDTKDDSCVSPSSHLGGQIFEKFKSVPLFESDKQRLNSVSQNTVINSMTANEADIKLGSDCVAKLLPSVGFDTECAPVNEITDSLAKLTFITPDSQESHVSNNVTGVKIIQLDTNIDSENVNIKSNANKRLLIFKSDCNDLHSSSTYSEEINKIMLSMDIFEENGALDRYYKHLNGMGFHTLDLSHITKDVSMLDSKSLESFYFLREQLHYHESVLRGLVHQASEPGTDRGWEIARKITEELEYIEGYEVACTVLFL